MKKLMLGIIAVLCAQLTFISYNDLEGPMDTAAVLPVTVLGQRLAVLDPESDIAVAVRSVGPTVAVPVKRKAAIEPAFATAKMTIKPTRRNVFDSSDLIAFQRPVIITYGSEYPTVSAVNRESDDRTYVESVKPYYDPKPYNEKKSLVSKALPILKKPFDWIKAIGSKFK